MSDIVPVRSTIAANGGKVIVSTGGQPVVGIELEGTWVGTLHLQETVSGDGFVDAQVTNAANTPVSAVVTGNGKFFVAAAGRSAIQVIATAWTSGTATVIGVPTAGSAGGSSGGGGAATIVDGGSLTFGAQADAAATTDNGTFSFISLFKRLLQKFTTQFPAALTGSGNLKVSVAESTASQAITAASLPLPTGAATDTTLGTTNTEIGGLTETAPVSDTASSGLNGRLQRVAQRLSSLIALLPTALITNRLDVNLGAAPATVTIASPTVLQGAQGAAGTASWNVQGAVAAGVSTSGINPILAGGNDGSGTMRSFIAQANNSDGIGNGQIALLTQAQGYAFSGTGGDRVRNNVDVTLLTSAARTTTQPGSNITAYNCQAIAVTLDVTAIVSTCSLTVTIGYVDPASGKVVNLLTSAVIAAVSTTMLLVDPRVVAAANLVAMKPIGRVFVITVTVGNANSQTYSVGYTLIPC